MVLLDQRRDASRRHRSPDFVAQRGEHRDRTGALGGRQAFPMDVLDDIEDKGTLVVNYFDDWPTPME